jgi:putative addiction module component (TIGR02574 family)
MAGDAARILRDALQLAELERAGLAADLLDSLAPARDLRSNQDWITEVERRARAAISSEPGVPWEEAQAKVRGRLNPK